MTTDPAESHRQAAATLRAMADLIDARPDLPLPRVQARYWASANHCGDVPAALLAITGALPGPWKASIRRSGEYTWLYLDSATGAEINVGTPASEACEPSGTRTVTTWQPLPAIAGLIGDPAALEEL